MSADDCDGMRWCISDDFNVAELNSGTWYCNLCGQQSSTFGDLSYLLLLLLLIILIVGIIIFYRRRK